MNTKQVEERTELYQFLHGRKLITKCAKNIGISRNKLLKVLIVGGDMSALIKVLKYVQQAQEQEKQNAAEIERLAKRINTGTLAALREPDYIIKGRGKKNH